MRRRMMRVPAMVAKQPSAVPSASGPAKRGNACSRTTSRSFIHRALRSLEEREASGVYLCDFLFEDGREEMRGSCSGVRRREPPVNNHQPMQHTNSPARLQQLHCRRLLRFCPAQHPLYFR